MEQPRPASQKLPAGLAGVLNAPEENRDSAYYSSTDASSKHTSAASCIGVSILSPPGSVYPPPQSEKTPSPTDTGLFPQPLVSPSNSNMSVASIVSPTTPGSASRFDNRPVVESGGPNSAALPSMNGADAESMSCRESVDSRINQGFGEMRLGNSPYASHNQSTTSIQGTLAQQRNPRAAFDSMPVHVHRVSNSYQPSNDRNPPPPPPPPGSADSSHSKAIRTAPAITGPATSTIARAAEPTKGQAWAFPEEEIQRLPSAASQSLIDSRRSSVAESFASSQFTTESRLPPGQRRLDEAFGAAEYQQRLSNASGEFPAVHHHSLQQHKQLGDLQGEEVSPHNGSQPYSRTPELRVSHKLAERKRRTEMKELFEQLRDLMPQERGSKASKWEILTKAIAEHQRQQDHIKYMQQGFSSMQTEMEMMRREIQSLRVENSQMRETLQGGGGPAPSQPPTDPYANDPYGRVAPQRPELPPLRALSGGLPQQQQQQQQQPLQPNGPDSMTGVQYEQPRVNGFRPPERY